MRTNRTLQVLVTTAAVVAATFAGIVTAAPALACIGDCGTLGIQFVVAPGYSASYGYPLTLSGRVWDDNLECEGGSATPAICDDPTGTIEFSVDGVTVAEADLTKTDYAHAAWSPVTYSGAPAGARTFVAEYNGNFDSPTRASAEYSIAPALTTTQLQQTPASTVAGQATTVTATVAPANPGAIDLQHGAHLPTGQVEFFDGGTSLGKKDLDGQQTATATVVLSGNGNHDLYALYVGDGDYDWSLSSALPHAVTKGNTSLDVDRPAGPTVYGERVNFTATMVVTPPASAYPPIPTGTTTFEEAGQVLASANSPGLGVYWEPAAPLPTGDHTFKFVYSGDDNFNGSTAQFTHTVNKAATVTSVATTPNPSNLGEDVTLGASVAVVAPGSGTPTGTVQFFDGSTPLAAPVALSGPTATLTVNALGGGGHAITARYVGDANFNASTSAPQTHTVQCDVVVGNIAGNYTAAASRTTCITNASIGGNVTLPAGATVSITNSTIGGGLTASSGSGVIIVCGTSMGSASISGRTSAITLGSTFAAGCAGNVFRGAVSLISNQAGVRFDGNRVGGMLKVTGTTGGATFIGGNQISGALQCSGNTPAADNGGHPNTAAARTGECAAAGF